MQPDSGNPIALGGRLRRAGLHYAYNPAMVDQGPWLRPVLPVAGGARVRPAWDKQRTLLIRGLESWSTDPHEDGPRDFLAD